jgi:dTDP-4-amino-4,6-dideoxygalactose transaminase
VIPLSHPDLGPEEIDAVADVLRDGMVAQGRKVAELEGRWAEYCGVKHAVAVSSGTVALMSVFAGLGLGPGDEVITVAHTFNATVSSILFTGASPVFVDIEPDTYLMNAARIEAAITSRTRAICPVSLFGMIPDMDAIQAIADRHGLTVVEDAGQAHGAAYRGRRSGSFGYGAFSMYGTANMTTGEGGIVTTNDDRLADWIRLYRNHGMRERHHHEILGYNFRLTDISAAIGLVQLDKLEANTARRQAIARRYGEALADLPLSLPAWPDGRTHAFNQYTIGAGPARDEIVAEMQDAGVMCGIYYPIPCHRQAYVMELGIEADLPNTDAAAAGSMSLPIFPGLAEAEQNHVIEALHAAVLRHSVTTGNTR